MKWIGQHIWDFISRFRSDVYLEGTETGTIASGGNLGLDSNNKIVKATVGGTASTVTVTDSNANTAFPVVFHDESNGLLDDTGTFQYVPFSRNLNLSHSSGTVFSLYNTGNDNADSHIYFRNTRAGGASSDDDNLGTLTFQGHNDAGANVTTYADFTAYIHDASASNEAGGVKLVLETQGSPQQGLVLEGDASQSKIDTWLGHGTMSTTTIAGDLSVTTGLILDSVDVTTIQTSGESFADNDTSLMTSAAIDDRINASSGGTTISGTTANGIATYGGTDQIDIESTLTYGTVANQLMHNNILTVSGANGLNVVSGGETAVDGSSGVFTKLGGTNIGEFQIRNLKIHATAAGPSSISLQEDADNGTNTVKIEAPASCSDRTQTLQDSDGTVALTNKHVVVIRAAFHASSTSGYYLTIGGGTTGESSALAHYSYTNVFNCPYDGQVLRAAASTQSTGSKTVKLEMYINKDDSDLVADQRGSDWNVPSYTNSWCEPSPGDWTFSKGEQISIRATDSAAVFGTQYTVVLEFDLTT